MPYIEIGKIVTTHGLKGEIRIISHFKYKDQVFKPNMKIYIGQNKESKIITHYRYHKIYDMIMMKGHDDIDSVLKYKGEKVYINKEDLTLDKCQYLDEDIIGLRVYMNNEYQGIVKGIENYPNNHILIIQKEQKDYLIPYNFDIIEKVDLKKKEIHIAHINGLFE